MTPKAKRIGLILLPLACALGLTLAYFVFVPGSGSPAPSRAITYQPNQPLDIGGWGYAVNFLKPWKDGTSLEEIRDAFVDIGYRNVRELDKDLSGSFLSGEQRLRLLFAKASLLMFEGDSQPAYQVLQQARDLVEASSSLAGPWLYTVIFYEGVAGLRRGEDENCLNCRGEGACIFPIISSARHKKPDGSRLAVHHFTEYLEKFPEDMGVRWLLNLAYMTLGEHPGQVPPQYVIHFDKFGHDADIGRFKDISHLVGINRFNQAGGVIMDDFDNDGLLDLVVSDWDASTNVFFYRNKGDGTFEDRTVQAGLTKQLGGLNMCQTDYNNDGLLDIFIMRGGFWGHAMRPTLLRNNGDGTFTDVTREAGLIRPIRSNAAVWADYDNDGFVDLFIPIEKGPNLLYRNRGDGTFEEVGARAGVQGIDRTPKGAAWIDYDNDGYPDLFFTNLGGTSCLLHNNRNGTFTEVTTEMGINGPEGGYSCWAFDYDNDGFLDIFATCYRGSLHDAIRGMLGQPIENTATDTTRLFRNLQGKGFRDVTKEVGLDKVFMTMGSNFGDFDNDGYLDIYLSTGAPSLEFLVPNRMLKNMSGTRFADISSSSRTGHLQKGHGVACGDWDRDGNVDLFAQIGGATLGDRFHNALFQNPGQGNNWLTMKLIGKKSNRAALGARIKVVSGGDKPLTVHRHVTSGSSFGASPLQQTIGLGKAKSIERVEIYWPTSRTTQIFRDVGINQAIEVTEFAKDYRKLNWTPIPVPKD